MVLGWPNLRFFLGLAACLWSTVISQEFVKGSIQGTSLFQCLISASNSIITSGSDLKLTAWSTSNPPTQLAQATLTKQAQKLVATEDQQIFLVGYSDGNIDMYRFDSAGNAFSLVSSLTSTFSTLGTLLDANNLIFTVYMSALSSTTLVVIDTVNPTLYTTWAPPPASYTYSSMAFLEYTNYIFVGTSGGVIEVKDSSFQAFSQVTNPVAPGLPLNTITRMASVWRNELVFLGYNTGALRSIESRSVANANTLRTNYGGAHAASVTGMTWFNLTAYLVTADSGGKINIWDVITGSITPVFTQTFASRSITVLAPSFDKKKFLVGAVSAAAGEFSLWNPTGLGCHPTCAAGSTCKDSSEFGCSSCKSGYSFESSTSFCNIICPPGQYQFRNNNTCVACYPTCTECIGASVLQCTVCSGGLVISTNRSCVSTCPTATFLKNTTHCDFCYPTCQTCKGYSKDDCITCVPGRLMDIDNQCVAACSKGAFKNSPTTCQKCDPTCVTCNGGLPTNCTTCLNPEWNYLANGTCVDCSVIWDKRPEVCLNAKEIFSVKKSIWNYDMYSSSSYEVVFKNISFLITTFQNMSWNEMLDVKIDGLKQGVDFTKNFVYRYKELILDLNFTYDSEKPVTLVVQPIKFYFNYNNKTNLSSFLLSAKSASIANVGVYQYDSPWLIKMSRNAGIVLNLLVDIYGWITLVTTLVLMFFEIDISRPFIDFIRMVKPVSRFKYINIYYGGITEIFLTNFRNVFQIVSDSRTDENEKFFIESRASLRRFYLPVLTFTSIPDKYFLYLVLVLLKLFRAKIYQYSKGRKYMTPDDEFLVDMVDRIKIPMFFFLIFDVVFYTSHTLVHQSLLVKQTRNSYFSIALAMILLMMFTFEFIIISIQCHRYKTKGKQEILQELIVRSVVDIQEAYPTKTLKEVLRRFKKRALEVINELYINFENKLGTKSPEVRFFESELKQESLTQTKWAKYYNLLAIMKVVLMEPIFITLQMNKLMQILSLLLIQAAFTFYVMYAAIKLRIFAHWWSYIFVLIHECALFAFFFFGFFFYLQGEARLGSGFDRIQFTLVLFLMLAVVAGVAKLGVGQYFLIRKKFRQNKSDKKVKDEVG